jgi:EAL domain-containing protein (putative c-di-GMP-specific phosphodiesterase class I)
VLIAMGCNTFQGYLFAPALTVGDIEARFLGDDKRIPAVA